MNTAPHGLAATPQASELLAAAKACDRAAEAQTPEQEMRAIMDVWAHKETIQLALLNAQLGRVAATHTASERLPLRDDAGDIGRIEARIPKRLFFHLQQQPNFGLDGFCDNGGMKDFLKAFPQCRVKTISGKTTVGWRKVPGAECQVSGGKPDTSHLTPRTHFVQTPRFRRVHFARGTLNLAT